MKKKVLVFGLSNRVGGVENFYFSYYRKLDHTKYQIDFVVKYNTVFNEKEVKENGGRIFSIPNLRHQPFLHHKLLKNIIKKGNYDIVHANAVSVADILHLKLARKYKVKKIIIHSHNSGMNPKIIFRFFHAINKHKLKKLGTHFLACTKQAGEWLFGKKLDFQVLNNAFDIDKFKYNEKYREEIRKKLKIKDEFVIGHVGRMCYQKNQEFLIKVFKEYLKINKKSKLILIGCGHDEENIRNLIDELNLTKNVLIIHSDDPYKYYSAFDIFAFPSRYEGLGIVGIEAQINGLPCLFSNTIPSDIKINNNVDFLPITDIEKWVKLLTSKKLKRVDKINSRIKKYDIENEVKKLEKIYQGD
ncbi:MAG: glycosyltransferase [Bacilli bacterium]|nr:glycosyltransferase [Bacilli bacterium]